MRCKTKQGAGAWLVRLGGQLPGNSRIRLRRTRRASGAREMIIESAGNRGGTEFGLPPFANEGAPVKAGAPSLLVLTLVLFSSSSSKCPLRRYSSVNDSNEAKARTAAVVRHAATTGAAQMANNATALASRISGSVQRFGSSGTSASLADASSQSTNSIFPTIDGGFASNSLSRAEQSSNGFMTCH
jgi:hypothetical protein